MNLIKSSNIKSRFTSNINQINIDSSTSTFIDRASALAG